MKCYQNTLNTQEDNLPHIFFVGIKRAPIKNICGKTQNAIFSPGLEENRLQWRVSRDDKRSWFLRYLLAHTEVYTT